MAVISTEKVDAIPFIATHRTAEQLPFHDIEKLKKLQLERFVNRLGFHAPNLLFPSRPFFILLFLTLGFAQLNPAYGSTALESHLWYSKSAKMRTSEDACTSGPKRLGHFDLLRS